MSINKVEMSLDEIIKADRKKDNATRSNGKRGVAGRSTIAKRKPAFNEKKSAGGVRKRGRVTSVKSRKNVNSNRFNKNAPRNVKTMKNFRSKNQSNVKLNTIATKRLVQNLVKKALAQRSFRGRSNQTTSISLRRRGGVRLVKKTVVLNRVSPKSRVINQRRRVVPVMTLKQQRAPIRFETVPQTVHIMPQKVIRRNYVPVQPRKFVDRRPIVVHQPRMARSDYQLVQMPFGRQNRGAGTVRQQINAMRRQTVYVKQQDSRRTQPQFRQRQQRVTYTRDQRSQQRQRFQGRRRQNNQNYSHSFEPQNFLQRIPVQKQARR